MIEGIKRYFGFEQHKTTLKTEILAGFTTFITMGYIIVVNPKILEVAGIPFGASMVATILSAAFGTLLMGIYAKRPFAVAPYMGENAFIAYTVVGVLGYSWQTALGAIFISGILFTLITVLKLRSWLANSIPTSLKIGFTVGIGLFLAFIGLNETGIVELGVPGAPVHIGDFHNPSVLLAIFGFLLIGVLLLRHVTGALLIGIVTVTVIAILTGLTPVPDQLFSLPPSLEPTFLQMDIGGALTWGFFSVILTVLVMDFVDTLGTLLGLAVKADLLDDEGNLPDIEKPMMVDALATTVAACLGTTTTGAYIESATGIQAGGRTGMTAVVVAILFLLALFIAPIITAVPAFAYGPSLIIVGLLMMSNIHQLDFDMLDEAIPVFCTIVLMSFTFNIGIGMTAGFVLFPLFKLLAGKRSEINAGMLVLAGLSLLFYVFYPY
jgi:AGZA family xanthine/uracil permease-like MFS transporter